MGSITSAPLAQQLIGPQRVVGLEHGLEELAHAGDLLALGDALAGLDHRFEHALGAYHLARRALERCGVAKIARDGLDIQLREVPARGRGARQAHHVVPALDQRRHARREARTSRRERRVEGMWKTAQGHSSKQFVTI